MHAHLSQVTLSVTCVHLRSVGRIRQFGGDVENKTFHHVHLLVSYFDLHRKSFMQCLMRQPIMLSREHGTSDEGYLSIQRTLSNAPANVVAIHIHFASEREYNDLSQCVHYLEVPLYIHLESSSCFDEVLL